MLTVMSGWAGHMAGGLPASLDNMGHREARVTCCLSAKNMTDLVRWRGCRRRACIALLPLAPGVPALRHLL
jgi:hypothetical protein